MPQPPKAILFDIGNVLLRLKTQDFLARVAKAHPGIDTEGFLKSIREPQGLHAAYERGQITGREFHAALQQDWGLAWNYEEWLRQWNDYFVPNPPMEVLIAKLAGLGELKPRFFGLSNTNAEHYQHVKQNYRLFDGFEAVFGSQQFGLRKPEPEFFLKAVECMGLAPGEVVFLDDIEAFVQVAQGLGLRGFQYRFNDLELKDYMKQQGLEIPAWDRRPGHLGC